MPLTFTKTSLDPIAKACWDQARARLDPGLSARLRSSRNLYNHGSYTDVFLFDTWDTGQCGVFHRQYFKYCLAFDPARRKRRANVYFHFWVNRTRIYQEAERVRGVVDRVVRSTRVDGFDPVLSEGEAELIHLCEWSRGPEGLPDYLAPRIARLVTEVHPQIIPLFESFTHVQTPEERTAEIAARTRRYTGPAKRRPAAEIREYTRSVPPSWRPILLQRAGGKCALCGAPLALEDMHADHIVPFSRGGKTVLKNLQATCASCNLSKGAG